MVNGVKTDMVNGRLLSRVLERDEAKEARHQAARAGHISAPTEVSESLEPCRAVRGHLYSAQSPIRQSVSLGVESSVYHGLAAPEPGSRIVRLTDA
jgi:hypothetical protein